MACNITHKLYIVLMFCFGHCPTKRNGFVIIEILVSSFQRLLHNDISSSGYYTGCFVILNRYHTTEALLQMQINLPSKQVYKSGFGLYISQSHYQIKTDVVEVLICGIY